MLLLQIDRLKSRRKSFLVFIQSNKPERKQTPGTATGTVRCRAVTVARAISSAVAFFLQSKPEMKKNRTIFKKKSRILHRPDVTIFGFNKVPSKKT